MASKNSVDTYGAEGKTNLLMFDPDKLTLVTEESHPLFDPRVHRSFVESTVLNMMHMGVQQPIAVRKNPETGDTEVVAGRGRVINLREANRRLRERGAEPFQIAATVKRATDDGDLMALMIVENEHRQDDTPLGRATKMQRLMDKGKSEEQTALVFGVSVATVKAHLAMLECSAPVRKAIDAGDINVTQAKALSKLEPAVQREKLAELQQAGNGTNGHAKAKAQRQVLSKGPTMRGKKEITAKRDEATGDYRAALEWVLGVA